MDLENFGSKALNYEDLIRHTTEAKSDLNKIMEACNLTPLPSIFDRVTFGKSLRHRIVSDEDIVTKGNYAALK